MMLNKILIQDFLSMKISKMYGYFKVYISAFLTSLKCCQLSDSFISETQKNAHTSDTLPAPNFQSVVKIVLCHSCQNGKMMTNNFLSL